MKKFCFVLLVVLSLSLCGCAEDNPYVQAWNDGVAKGESIAQDAQQEQDRLDEAKGRYFEIVADDTRYGISYFRDIRTDVMYVRYWDSTINGIGVAISVMYCADGLPLTYEKWSKMVVQE